MQTVNDYTVLDGLIIKEGPRLKIFESPETTEKTTRLSSINMGYFYVEEFTSVTQTYYLKNTGDETTVVNSLKVYTDFNSKTESTNFTLDKTENIILAPGGYTELKITFTAPKEKKQYSVSMYADSNVATTMVSSLISINAEVTGYALAKCGSNYSAVRVENQESVSKTLHLFNGYSDCYENNTETIPNSAAVISFGPIAPSSTTEYKCVDIADGRLVLSDGIGGRSGCLKYSSESFELKKQYKIIIKSSLMDSHSMIEE